jgi:hypothetical protein
MYNCSFDVTILAKKIKIKMPDIVLSYPESFPEKFGDIIVSDIKHEKLTVVIEKKPYPQMWNGIDWLLPTAIAVYIFKPYFESFLKEAGKDHYSILKESLSKLLKPAKESPVKTVVSRLSPEKINQTNQQSKTISIHIEVNNGRRIKLLFDDKLSIDDWVGGLNSFLELTERHYLEYPKDELTLKIDALNAKDDPQIFGTINPQTKEWNLQSKEGLIRDQMEKNK